MSREARHFLWIKILKADNTSFVENLNRLDMLSLTSDKRLAHSFLKEHISK